MRFAVDLLYSKPKLQIYVIINMYFPLPATDPQLHWVNKTIINNIARWWCNSNHVHVIHLYHALSLYKPNVDTWFILQRLLLQWRLSSSKSMPWNQQYLREALSLNNMHFYQGWHTLEVFDEHWHNRGS